ncbi:MAG: 50S ribosomal protein L25 [Verrucomicrobia bacterium]|nr:MAG: 50S ribosomal protein L25 [Verrucomicrobiota bacterium]
MAKQLKLSAAPRTESGRNAVKKVRARGGIPAVIYGGSEAPDNLEINRREIEKILSHAVGENLLVELQIAAQGKTRLSLIQEVQHHPVRGEILHVDFQAVSATETIQAEIPVEAKGESKGVKTGGGLLEQSLRVLLVECLPQNLPDVIHMDVSALEIGQSYHVRDLVLPEGVQAITDPELTVFRISEPTVAVEPTALTEQPSAPEVIKEKKSEAAAAQEAPKK